ncbi:MAG: efflux RND transporter permease subunit [Bacteroidia bacterium]|nr:efflux RND transporter permease subunit [Bacteroidia bacterium]MCZ2277432.1 efflux RND transporter permease subunit [Bacteroidia bacterium]
MLKTFIDRPVLSTVISIILVILGILGLSSLPVTQYPDIAPPTVQVMTQFPGANAQTVMGSVIIPLEEQINGVEGMTYMTSEATNDGRANITVFFDQDYDPDIATVNVQNRVAQALPLVPQEVKQVGVITRKQQTSALMFLNVYSTNPDYDAKFIANYLNINVIPEIQRVRGVGFVNIYSSQYYTMRIWIKPDKLAAYGLVPDDIRNAVNEQSQETAAGVLGESSGESFSYTIRYKGRLQNESEYADIILKSLGNGQFLRLKDVADIELGQQNYTVASNTNGYPSISLGIFQTKGSNAREIIKQVKEKLETAQKSFPHGVKIMINYDTNEFLDASIKKVVTTLIEAFILVSLVVFIFLQDFRSTIIPAIAVPVSIIGTFFFLGIFGYSVNLLTLFALVLAIGIVVDDAIVVVEAVHAKLDGGEKDQRKATYEGMHEIAGAIVSITLVMAAVFIPVTFITGPTGVFFKQFGVTLMTAIVISAVNALTLSPALCAVFLRAHSKDEKKKNLIQRFHTAFNATFSATLNRYERNLRYIYKHKWITPVVIVIAGLGIWWSSSNMSTGFVPSEDRGIVFVNLELPVGSSIDRTEAINRKFYAMASKIPGVESISLVSGFSLINGQGSNNGLGFIKLESFEKRMKDKSKSVDAIVGKLFGLASSIKGGQYIFFAPPSIPGYGASGGFEVNLQDRMGGSFAELSDANKEFLMKLNQRPEIQYAQSSFSTNFPQYQLDVNVPVAKESGVSLNSIFNTLQGYIGGIYAADFARFGKQYRVYIQALPEDRVNADALEKMYVRTGSGEMAPISQFVSLKRIYGPQSVKRFNLFNASKITGAANPGYSTGDAIKAIEEVATEMPSNLGIDYSGLTREEVMASGKTILIFLLVVIFVYFLLAAQYESYLLPLSIILSVPLGIFGAYFVTMLFGMENNIYFQVALIMLVGLLAKNAILIVEFAIQRRRHGESLLDSAIDGAKARLRPILMTSFAFIFGLMPLALANGVGAVGNRAIGTTAVSGMLIGTVFGVFVIPTLYIFFQWIQEKFTGPPVAVSQTLNSINTEGK